MPNPSLRPAHPGQRQHPPDLLRLLVEGPIGLALSFGRNLQQFGGHRQQHPLRSIVKTTRENSGGVAPAADITVNSLTATGFVDNPELRSSAGDLQIQNALVTIRKEDGALLASFADGGISPDRDVTVAAASTLDFAQLFVGSIAATGTFNSSSSVTANLEVAATGPRARGQPALSELVGRQNGVAELKALAGGVMLNSFQQFISFNNTSGLTNLAIEPNIGGSNDGEVIFGYGFVNLSDRALKENVRAIPEEELQQIFDRKSTTASTAARGRSASWPRTCRPVGSWARRCARPRTWTVES